MTQGLQGLPLYLGRIIFGILVVLIYGGTYWKLNYTFYGAEERTTVLFLVAAVLPALSIGTLPFYHNGTRVGRPCFVWKQPTPGRQAASGRRALQQHSLWMLATLFHGLASSSCRLPTCNIQA